MNLSSIAQKKDAAFHLYAMSGEADYFLDHPNTVLLGFLGAVATILLGLIILVWVGYQIF